jgi:hypothetical protein
MISLTWYMVGALALVLAIFYFVRKIPAYLALSVVVVGAFAAASISRVDWGRPAEWLVMVVGLLLCIFGLLIVRVMLVRSVSLRLLARMDSGQSEGMVEDLGGRFGDMRAFGLITGAPDGRNTLTAWGRTVSSIVAVLYSVVRIET